MLKPIITLLTIFISFNSFAQITFDQGYFINEKNEKIDCWIKNIDWRDNPTKFQYKLSEKAETQIATIESVKEFGIDNFSKYQRFDVEMDRSSKEVEDMSKSREPEFKQERLFLKILIDGKATLYLYREKNFKRYFIKTIDAEIEQLVFKKYKTSKNQVKENRQFLVQLRDQLKCESTTTKKLKKLEYKKKPLIKIFEEYNQCANAQFTNLEKLSTPGNLNLSIRPGLRYSTFNSGGSLRSTEFENKISIRLGLELEYVLAFNKNKWSVIFEPTFQYFKSKGTTNNLVVGRDDILVEYRSIEFPLGIRHYFFLNQNSKIFINAFYSLDLPFKSKGVSGSNGILELKSVRNFGIGLGYNFKNKFSVEVRHGLDRTISFAPIDVSASYKTVSLIFGYSIF